MEGGTRAGGLCGAAVLDGFVGKAKVVGDGVDDEECEVGDGFDGGFEVFKGGEGLLGFGVDDVGGVGEGVEFGESVDVGEVSAEGVEFWAEGVGEVVFGGEEEGGGGSFEFRVSSFKRGEGHGVVAGEEGGEVEEEGGFAGGGVSGEEGDFSAGDAGLPEPVEGFGLDGGELADVDEWT